MVIPGIRGMSVKQFFGQFLKNFNETGVSDSAAALAYYLLFSLFPFLFFLVTLAAYLPIQGVVQDALLRARTLMPAQALDVVSQHVNDLVSRPRPHLLTLGLATSLYSASQAMSAARGALNRAYNVTESRPLWKTLPLAIGVTFLMMVLFLLCVGGVLVGSHLGYAILHKLHLGTGLHFLWAWVRWPATAIVVMFAAALGYYLLPDVKQDFKFITPGSVAASLFWLLTSWGFTYYTDHFGSYGVTYGSLGGVIVLLLWFYFSSLIYLVGGVCNVTIEHASPEGKAKGARVPGAPPATPEEQLVAKVPGASKKPEVARGLKHGFLFHRRRPHPG